jgi:2-polyprenyl-3-methyl-5-hydroxy-6-metoxy-1,4-benzoquinol methylase
MTNTDTAPALADRIAREKAAHEDSHIDDALRKWWAVFPHAFTNPSMESLGAFFREELGSIENKLVLELGCGQGDFAVWLLDHGANVFGIDISEFNIKRCREKVSARNVDPARYAFSVMNAHETNFPDKYFDRIVGNGILHHLELPAAMSEVERILKPGAKALFQEPLGESPLLRLYRSLAGIHTVDERPLTRSDLSVLTDQWSVKTRFSGLVTFPVSLFTSIVLRQHPNNWLLRGASHVESLLNDRHILDHWNRFAVLVYGPTRCADPVYSN